VDRTLNVPERDHTAQRLLKSSAKNSFDPEVDIDWDAPLPEDLPYMPLHRSSLYGTHLWDKLTHEQRIELTKHELTSIASSGVWFEMLLMRMLLKEAYGDNPKSSHVHYALTEVGDECRHSTMFGKMIDRMGTPAYGPPQWMRQGGHLLVASASGPSMFAMILVAEEILDQLQRDQMDDEGVQPLVRMVNRIHVVEEARHVSFAREEVVRRMRDCRGTRLAYQRYMTAAIGYCVVYSLLNPRVYQAVGLPPKETHRIAWSNPYFHQSLRWYARKIMSFLDEVGLIGKPGLQWWRRAHLMD
jgi:hypothetical protein